MIILEIAFDIFISILCWIGDHFILLPLIIIGGIKERIWPSKDDHVPLDPTVNLDHYR